MDRKFQPANSLTDVLDEILALLIAQKDVLVAAGGDDGTYNKDATAEAANLLRAIERTVTLKDRVDGLHEAQAKSNAEEMSEFMKAVDDRINELAGERSRDLVAKAAEQLCSECRAQFGSDEPAGSAAAAGEQ